MEMRTQNRNIKESQQKANWQLDHYHVVSVFFISLQCHVLGGFNIATHVHFQKNVNSKDVIILLFKRLIKKNKD